VVEDKKAVSKYKMTPLSWNELIHKLKGAGFDGPYQEENILR
jgi:hypothetical protein